jgi:hypothetical protein
LYNEENTIRGGARFQWPIVATSFHAVDPTVNPNHDADIRIGSEAPKQRRPFLHPASKPLDVASNRYLGSFFGRSLPKLMIRFFR